MAIWTAYTRILICKKGRILPTRKIGILDHRVLYMFWTLYNMNLYNGEKIPAKYIRFFLFGQIL